MRGGDAGTNQTVWGATGPSPHARGRLDVLAFELDLEGTIPACAGETRPTPVHLSRRRDHPRMRGGDWRSDGIECWREGPSPHARGRPDQVCKHTGGNGTIPACAGETYPDSEGYLTIGDHPRMRGGDYHIPNGGNRDIGTIPACAGETLGGSTAGHEHRDHPRMRGGDEARRCEACDTEGPSPHARGRPMAAAAAIVTSVTIPACAGETSVRGEWRGRWRDHPRMRGGDYGVG